MTHIEEWGKDKTIQAKILAQAFAPISLTLRDILSHSKRKIFFEFLPKPQTADLKFYYQHRTVYSALCISLRSLGEYGVTIAELLEGITHSRTAEELSDKLKNFSYTTEQISHIQQQELHMEAKETRSSETDTKSLIEAINTPELSFLIRVVIPCIFLHKTSPTLLFRKARQGDVESLCKLLRIDKQIIHHPRIIKHIAHYSQMNSGKGQDEIIQALPGSPKGSTTLRKIKYSLAGIIAFSSNSSQQQTHYPSNQTML